MEKKKETPWTDRKILFKDGNPEIFRKFTWLTWKNMTEGERAMWTELPTGARAPIPKETIEFEKTVKAANKPDASAAPRPTVIDEDNIIMSAHETVIDEVRAKLKERGIKFAYNSKLETLQKKLADADNSE